MQVIVLNREEVKSVLEMGKVADGVRNVYRMKAQGKTGVWPLVSHDFTELNAVMDIRSGFVGGEFGLHGLKMLNSFPLNRNIGLPPFNGMLMLFDSKTGIPLGVMDASYITCMRTGAASAIGASTLSRPDSKKLMILGAGKQSAYQLAAAVLLMPNIEEVRIADPLDAENAARFASAMPERLVEEFGIKDRGYVKFSAAPDLPAAVNASDIVITITPSRAPVIMKEWVKPGTHFSCIGADMEGKEEIDPEIFRGARIFADDKPQCMRVGEMEIPIKKGVIGPDDVAGELGEVLDGRLEGRRNAAETTIFDATGLALLDIVTAKAALDGANARKIGTFVEM